MSMKAMLGAIAAFTAALYGASIVGGVAVRDLKFDRSEISTHSGMAWTPPRDSSIPKGLLGDSIRRGRLIFTETPLYASDHATAKINCSDCHAEGGIQPYASPVVAVPALFPQFNQRAGRVISLKDRIQECFVRSENGTPVDYDGEQMKAVVDYINWLSTPEPNRQKFLGRGLVLRRIRSMALRSMPASVRDATARTAKARCRCFPHSGGPIPSTMAPA